MLGIPFSAKIREGFRLRRLRLRAPFLKKLEQSFWIHAASGEYEYARPLLRELKERHPEVPIVVTFFSPTYMKVIDKDPLVDYSIPLPFDFPGAIQSLIRKIRPQALFIARTDLWPEMLSQCRRFSVPRILFSYHHSRSRSWWSSFIRMQLLSELSHIDCVSEESKEWVKESVHTPVTAFGDTRYDQVQERKLRPKPIPFEMPKGRIIVLGSTWPEDEEVILKALRQTRESWDMVVLAPHEPTSNHLADLRKNLESQGFSYELFSKAVKSPQSDFLILDQVGYLFDFYRYSDLSFVGNSFKSKVHSVMEPLSFGNRVLLGPKIHNSYEALDFKRIHVDDKPVVEVCNNSKSLAEGIESHFRLPEDQRSMNKMTIEGLVKEKSGASKSLLTHLEDHNIYHL